jgi:uncharacterized damage-inducible protein DinB
MAYKWFNFEDITRVRSTVLKNGKHFRMQNMLHEQYNLVKSSRSVVLEYVSAMSGPDFISSSATFGRGSVRNLLVHICDTYQHWIANNALGLGLAFKPYDQYNNPEACAAYFETVDVFMETFIARFADDYLNTIPVLRNNKIRHISPLQLFSHVITHEFHHKGQLMSLSRELGYLPVDADIIR